MRLLALPALAATLLVLAPLLLVLAACSASTSVRPAPEAAPAQSSSPAQAPTPSEAPVLRSPSSPQSDAQAAAVEAARRDAAQRLSSPPESLQVEDVESRQWPDRSLGCPRQGVQYAQILTPGFLIVLSGGGRRLEYHADDRGMAVFCQEQS